MRSTNASLTEAGLNAPPDPLMPGSRRGCCKRAAGARRSVASCKPGPCTRTSSERLDITRSTRRPGARSDQPLGTPEQSECRTACRETGNGMAAKAQPRAPITWSPPTAFAKLSMPYSSVWPSSGIILLLHLRRSSWAIRISRGRSATSRRPRSRRPSGSSRGAECSATRPSRGSDDSAVLALAGVLRSRTIPVMCDVDGTNTPWR